MQIDHVHFYTRDALSTSNWLIRNIGFQAIANHPNYHTHTEIVANNSVFLFISSPLQSFSPVAQYLNCHPSGVADIAFRVENIEAILAKVDYLGGEIIQPLQTYSSDRGQVKWATIAGWDSLQHTLIENNTGIPFWHLLLNTKQNISGGEQWLNPTKINYAHDDHNIVGIDHLVLNVAAGELDKAVIWYQKLFGFKIQQTFRIQTKRSGLHSKALLSPNGQVQFNINEPTSADSQIQEFIDVNRGAGIQHIALRSTNIFKTAAIMQSCGVSFLSVPKAYYTQLQQRYSNQSTPGLADWEWQAIESQQILVDWQKDTPESLLMQIFTQPIFDRPTFFWELIERRQQAQGFGEGNFQALFEAVEREQLKRVS